MRHSYSEAISPGSTEEKQHALLFTDAVGEGNIILLNKFVANITSCEKRGYGLD